MEYQQSQPEPEPTVDQEQLAVDEDESTRQEEDESLQDQEQQKEAEEEKEEEDLMSLLKPFTKEQLHGIVKQVAKKASNFFYEYYGVNFEEEQDLDLQDERLDKYLESISCCDLHEFLISAEDDLPTKSLVCQVAYQAADVNPPHLKILVQSHGFRWDATLETLSSVFNKYGEITEIQVCENITKKITGYAFISFKHWSGASKALKQPLKKIGNRWTVSKLAISAGLALEWLESAYNSEEWANNFIQEFLKVADCPILRLSGLKLGGAEDHPTRQIYRLYHEHETEEFILLWKLHQWIHGKPVNRARPPIHITYCGPASMNYGTSSGCNTDTSILNSGQGGGARPQPGPPAPYKGH